MNNDIRKNINLIESAQDGGILSTAGSKYEHSTTKHSGARIVGYSLNQRTINVMNQIMNTEGLSIRSITVDCELYAHTESGKELLGECSIDESGSITLNDSWIGDDFQLTNPDTIAVESDMVEPSKY